MDPLTATIVPWLLQKAGGAIFAIAQQHIMRRLGLDSSQPPDSEGTEPSLHDYLRQLKDRLDEDRIAKLYGAFSKLVDASQSVVKQGLLVEALDKFHEVSQIPQQGVTGGQTNAALRCMAFVGMAASYILLQDQPVLIAGKMVEAVQADADTAKQWLGDDLVQELASRFAPPGVVCPKCGFQNPAGSQFCNKDGFALPAEVVCSKCGFQNPAGSKFCNRDGYPLSPPLSPQTATLHLIRQPAFVLGICAFLIILNGKEIGIIHNGRSCTLEVQAGHHSLFMRYQPARRMFLTDSSSSSPSLSFEIAPGEKVTFLCQAKGSVWVGSGEVLLWKQ
jgi:hypothetical protein